MSSRGKEKEATATASDAPSYLPLEKKKYQYRPPRLGDAFQANVPTLDGEGLMEAPVHSHGTRISTGTLRKKSPHGRNRGGGGGAGSSSKDSGDDGAPDDLRPNQLSVRDGMIWDPNAVLSEEVDDYLIYTRSLIEQTSHSTDRTDPAWRQPVDSKEAIPLEADEQALFYLYQQRYNVDIAELRVTSDLGVNKEHKFLHALDTLYQSGATAASLERRDRTSLVGAFVSNGTPSVNLSRGPRPAQYPYPYSYPTIAPPVAATENGEGEGKTAGLEGEKEEEVVPMQEDVRGNDEHQEEEGVEAPPPTQCGPAFSESRKKRSADKIEAKKQWLSVLNRGEMLTQSLAMCRKKLPNDLKNRPTQVACFALLKDVAALPNLDLLPGDESAREMEQYALEAKDVIAKSRKFVAKVHDAFNTTASQGWTLGELKALLKELRSQPLLLREEKQLSFIIGEAESWLDSAYDLMKHLDRASLLAAQDLMTAAEAIPVHFDCKAVLQETIDGCLALARDINAAIPPKGRAMQYLKLESLIELMNRAKEQCLHFPEGDTLAEVIQRAQKWSEDAAVAVSASPDLKKLTHLLEESTFIPVDLSETCAVIQSKVEQACKWVEKVRKALPRKNKTRSNATDAGKVDYTAAKGLLTEGNDIRVDVKELEDIAGVLDTAETWLQRVRGALEQQTDEAGLDAMESLLSEADNIPVEMDEHKILAAEIEARRWGLRVQPQFEKENIKVEDLERLISEGTALRARLPLTAKDQRAWRLPAEIAARKRLDRANYWLKEYRRCINPSGTGFRRNVTIQRLIDMVEKSRHIPVDLSDYSKTLLEGIADAERWYEESKDLLKACGIKIRTRKPNIRRRGGTVAVSSESKDSVEMDVDDDDDASGGAASASMDEDNEHSPQKEEATAAQEEEAAVGAAEGEEEEREVERSKVELSMVAACVASSDIGVELPEAEEVKTLMNRVSKWTEELGNVCPKRLSKRRGRAKATAEEVNELIQEGLSFPVDVSEEIEKVTERLEATQLWQAQVKADLTALAKESLEDAEKFEIKPYSAINNDRRFRENKTAKEKEEGDEEASAASNKKGAGSDGKEEGEEGDKAQADKESSVADAVMKKEDGVGEKDGGTENAAENGGGSGGGGGGRSRGRPNKDAEEEDEDEDDRAEARVKKLEGMVDEAGDIVIETAEEDMIARHLRAHKWFSDVTDLLQYVDPAAEISDGQIQDMEEVLKDGEKLLFEKTDEDEEEEEQQEDEEEREGDGEEREDDIDEKPLPPRDNVAMEGDDDDEEEERQEDEKEKEEGEQENEEEMERAASAFMEIDDDGSGEGAQDEGTEKSVKDEAEEEDEEKAAGAAAVRTPPKPTVKCDEVLQKMLLLWWDRLARLRDIYERSKSWLAKARKKMAAGDKVKVGVVEQLVAEGEAFDFKLEYLKKVKNELARAQGIKTRAHAALEGKEGSKMEFQAVKTLINEGDKCRVFVEEIRALKKHLAAGQKWLLRYQKAKPENLVEMKALFEDAQHIQCSFGEEWQTVKRAVDRCCFCRQTTEGNLVRCTECGERYHQNCLDVREHDAENWERRGWCCPRCLVRWHMRDALAKTMIIVSKWIASPTAPTPPPPPMDDGMTMDNDYMTTIMRQSMLGGELTTTKKVKAWMKRLLQAVILCADRDSEEVRTLGSSRLVKGSVLVEVIRLAKGDADVDKSPDVKEVIWNLSVVFWGARLICQLRRRPSLVPLQALTAEMRSVGIHNEPLQVMLNSLIARSLEWIYKTKPILREAWLRGDSHLDIGYLRSLLREKKRVPVRLLLARRLESMLSEEEPGKRYCHCRGFYDGLFMVQCHACQEWFHGRCVQIRPEDLDKKVDYLCMACTEIRKVMYPYPPYRAPDPDLALAEVEDDEEELIQVQDDELLANKASLEGIFPCKKKLASLDIASQHVDVNVLPLPPPTGKRKKSSSHGGGAAGGGSSGEGQGMKKKYKPSAGGSHLQHYGNMGMGGGGMGPAMGGGGFGSGGPSAAKTHLQEYSDPSLDIPPLPPKPKTQKKKVGAPPPVQTHSSSYYRDHEMDSPVAGGGASISSYEGGSGQMVDIGKSGRRRKPPKGGDDYVFER